MIMTMIIIMIIIMIMIMIIIIIIETNKSYEGENEGFESKLFGEDYQAMKLAREREREREREGGDRDWLFVGAL